MRPRFQVAIVIFAVISFGFFAVKVQLDQWRKPTMVKWQAVPIGMSEADVRSMLGPPIKAYDASSAPVDYRIDGYGQPSRAIGHRVLIYFGADMVLYLWMDQNNCVEEKFQAVS